MTKMSSQRLRTVLAIESSCDETSVAWLSRTCDRLSVETNVVASQIPIHRKTRGVVPEVAAREHVKIIIPLVRKVMKGRLLPDIIAVTTGPGLMPALMVGVETAKALGYAWKRPVIAVNHIAAHILSNWIDGVRPALPALCLVVSGGHTELVAVRDVRNMEKIGQTRDDAAGEAFDKVAALLGLPYPGGPAVAKAAVNGNPAAYTFTAPMAMSKDFDFSFSGLKTQVYYLVKAKKIIGHADRIADVCASFQKTVVDVLIRKTLAAARTIGARSVLLAGGVAANVELRTRLAEAVRVQLPDMQFKQPALKYCTDNAAMIGAAALLSERPSASVFNVAANPNFEIPLSLTVSY